MTTAINTEGVCNVVSNHNEECDLLETSEDIFNIGISKVEKNINYKNIVPKDKNEDENMYIEPIANKNNLSNSNNRFPLSYLNKLDNKIKMKSPPAFQKVLFWPDDQLETRKKPIRPKQQVPSVLTSVKWREIKIQQQEKKREIEEAAILRKKIKLEKVESKKVRKEQMILNKIKKDELKLEKENQRLQKQKERIEQMENEKRKKEEELKKKKEIIQVKMDLEELRNKQILLNVDVK